ncbi:MAG: hypothetical protein H8E40_14970 [Chloroflexi bacterium]|nr:hypothetical protein [Chloroflexota bacterium]MBL7187140.1 hypothetical protein [Phycisphaerae bacterium]
MTYPNGNDSREYYHEEDANEAKDPSSLVLSYLICPQDAANAFLGALMITDCRARPQHFSFVSPIRPTRIQRILYGATLDEHVKIDVVAKKLLADVPVAPDVLFVDEPELVIARKITDFPTAFLTKNPGAEIEPGRLTTLKYDTGPNTEDQEAVGRILATLEDFVDLTEPFTRMREALKEVGKSFDESEGE